MSKRFRASREWAGKASEVKHEKEEVRAQEGELRGPYFYHPKVQLQVKGVGNGPVKFMTHVLG